MAETTRAVFKGISAGQSASFDEALARALQQARAGLNTNFFFWRLGAVRGHHGGTPPMLLEVEIEVGTMEGDSSGSDSIGRQPVVSVQRLDLSWLDRTHLHVACAGEVISEGWTDATLTPRVYVTPPADGYWEFDFTAKPPDQASARVMTPITAEHKWRVPFGSGATPQGVRVWAAENFVERPLSGSA